MTIILFVSFKSFSKSRSFVFVPKILSEYTSWNQDIDGGSMINGILRGNAVSYGASFELLYFLNNYFYLSGEYRYLTSNWTYDDSENYSDDDSWSNTSNASRKDVFLGAGVKTKNMLFTLSYGPMSSYSFNNYYSSLVSKAAYTGTAIKLEVSYLITRRVSLSGYYLTSDFNSVDFDGNSLKLPDALDDITYGALIMKTYGFSLNYAF